MINVNKINESIEYNSHSIDAFVNATQDMMWDVKVSVWCVLGQEMGEILTSPPLAGAWRCPSLIFFPSMDVKID